MIIRLVLLAVFFAWVVRAPLDYRTDLMAAAAKDNVELRLTNREADAQKAFLTGIKLPIGDKRRLRAISDLALVRWRQLKFKDAENLYRLAVIENKKSQSYDPVFVENMLNLGAVYRDQDRYAEAKSVYVAVLDYDRKFLKPTDAQIGRDLGNLGMNAYIEASSKDRGNERIQLMQKANDYLEQALANFGQSPANAQRASIALSNQYLVLRDLGETEKAKAAKAKADALDGTANRVCKLP